MADSQKAEGWACGWCGTMYPLHDRGKASADACCLCATCGTRPSGYLGMRTQCKICSLKESIETNKKLFADHEQTVAAQEKELVRLESQQNQSALLTAHKTGHTRRKS